MRHQSLRVGFAIGDVVSLRPDVINHAILLFVPIDSHYQTQIQIDSSRSGNDVVGPRTGASRRNSVDVQRGIVQHFEQGLASAIHVT